MDAVLHQVELGKDVFEVIINSIDLIVSKSEIGRSLGYSEGKIPAHFGEMIDGVILQVPQNCKIKAGYRLVEIEKSAERYDGLYVGKKFFKMQKIVTSQLKNAEQAALFLCTIGPAMETWVRQSSNGGDITLGYIIDAVASEAVECATDILHDHIGLCMREHGLSITNRYGPGYCNWSVSEQHLLFSLLPANFCGISLNESALMVPIKSTSGIIGIGKYVKRADYKCDKCGVKDCTYRTSRLNSKKHDRLQKQTQMEQRK
jgi:hypothetical protein